MRKESVLLLTLRNLLFDFQMVDYLKSDAFPLGWAHERDAFDCDEISAIDELFSIKNGGACLKSCR